MQIPEHRLKMRERAAGGWGGERQRRLRQYHVTRNVCWCHPNSQNLDKIGSFILWPIKTPKLPASISGRLGELHSRGLLRLQDLASAETVLSGISFRCEVQTLPQSSSKTTIKHLTQNMCEPTWVVHFIDYLGRSQGDMENGFASWKN